MMLGLEIVGEGATTKIYRDGDTAIKIYIDAPYNEADNEAEHQRFAYNAGLPVPAVYGVRRLDDNVVALDMAFIDGNPILRPKMDKDERKNAIHMLVKLQREVHKVGKCNLAKQTDRIAWKMKNTDYLTQPIKENLLSLLSQLDDGSDNLCHGDFHPLNVLYDGYKYWIIDWMDATAGNPLADACRTYLIFRQYMMRLAGIYLKLFCKESGAKQEDVLAWQPIIAAARLSEKLDEKTRLWLLDIVHGWQSSYITNEA